MHLTEKRPEPRLYLVGRMLFHEPLLATSDAPVTEGPVVGVSSTTTPYSDRDVVAMGTRARCQHGAVGAAGEAPQTGDEVADGAVAVGPADQFTQTVRGGLKQPRHDGELQKTEIRWCLQAVAQLCVFCRDAFLRNRPGPEPRSGSELCSCPLLIYGLFKICQRKSIQLRSQIK